MGGEVLAELVADDLGTGPEEGHGQRTRSHPGLEHPHAGADVGLDQDGAEILRVDDLGAPGHLQHRVGQGGPHDHEPPTGTAEDGGALRSSDEVVMGHDAHVGVERRSGAQVDQVPPLLRVDEQHPLAIPEDAPILGLRHAVSDRPEAKWGFGW